MKRFELKPLQKYCAKWRNCETAPFFCLGLTVTMLTAVVAASSADARITTLSDIRSQLTAPAYSAAERELLASQTLFAIENLFVHREVKVADFGSDHDPVPRLVELAAKAPSLTNANFHSELTNIFIDLHDLHTNYMAPAPIGCAIAFVPLAFIGVSDHGTDMVVVSRKLAIRTDLTRDIRVGWQLVEVNGQPVEALLRAYSPLSGGANVDAMRMRSIEMLSMLDPSAHPLPVQDSTTLTFKTADGLVSVQIPWLASVDDRCLSNSGRTPAQPALAPLQQMKLGLDEYKKHYNKLFGQPELSAAAETEANDPWSEVFDHAVITTPAGRLGYIKLKAFYWDNQYLEAGTVTEAFRRVVEEDLALGVGLVIDVRGNPGGLIVFAENLVQLFAPKGVEPTTVQMLANDLNADIFLKANGEANRWSEAVQRAMLAGNKYIEPLAITPRSEANRIGQIWFRPVVVLTDAGCYSACDLFAAGMQDNGAARIVGLHHSTGAGGANVMEYNTFRAIFGDASDNPFKQLPMGQNFRVSWRQTLRAGRSQGVTLEDRGVLSDVVIPLKPGDIGGESRDLMRAIHQVIDDMQPDYEGSLATRSGGFVWIANGSEAKWTEQVRGVDQINVERDGQLLAQIPVDYSGDYESVTLDVPSLATAWSDQKLTLIGLRHQAPVFRVVREVNWRGEYQTIPPTGLRATFTNGDLGPVKTALLDGPQGSGWQVVNGKLRVGTGPKYLPRVLSRAFLPLQLDGHAARLVLDIALEAEELSDSLRIYGVNPDDGSRIHLLAGSSIAAQTGASLAIPSGWARMDLVFEFESDENWNMMGPVLDNIFVYLR